MTEYGKEYYDKKAHLKDAAGKELSEKLAEIFEPETVIDVGCGDGRLTKRLTQYGADVKGVDNSQAAIEHNTLEDVEQRDLRDDHGDLGTYDLVICIEVAEHLEEEHADTLVETLTDLGDTIFFTAAKPGQPGKGHVNCREESYWIEKFEDQGIPYKEELSKDLKNYFKNGDVGRCTPWIPRNIMVFSTQDL